jgi:hypothetical protein
LVRAWHVARMIVPMLDAEADQPGRTRPGKDASDASIAECSASKRSRTRVALLHHREIIAVVAARAVAAPQQRADMHGSRHGSWVSACIPDSIQCQAHTLAWRETTRRPFEYFFESYGMLFPGCEDSKQIKASQELWNDAAHDGTEQRFTRLWNLYATGSSAGKQSPFGIGETLGMKKSASIQGRNERAYLRVAERHQILPRNSLANSPRQCSTQVAAGLGQPTIGCYEHHSKPSRRPALRSRSPPVIVSVSSMHMSTRVPSLRLPTNDIGTLVVWSRR